CDGYTLTLQMYAQIINTLKSQNEVAVFAAAGNGRSTNRMDAPACIRSVVSVGAVHTAALGTFESDRQMPNCTDMSPTGPDRVPCFSNSDTTLTPARPDLLAPGCQVTSARVGGGTSTGCGTSQATAHATGAAALLLQINPNLTPDQLKAMLQSTAVPVIDTRTNIQFGRMDLATSPDLAFESNASGRFQIWDVQTYPNGMSQQVTTMGGESEESRTATWAIDVDVNQPYIGTHQNPSDGRIAYQFGTPGVRGIHLIKPDGSDDVELLKHMADEDDRDPSWSPDCRFIVYASMQPHESTYNLWVYDTNKTPDRTSDDQQYLLMKGPGNLNLRPVWSPDFNSIVFVASGGGVGSHSQIFRVPVAFMSGKIVMTGPPEPLTTN